MRNIYQLALDAQDACNGSGLMNSLASEVLPAVWAESRALGKGTDYVNAHPVVYMFLHQLMFLAGQEPVGSSRWFECEKICREKANQPVPV